MRLVSRPGNASSVAADVEDLHNGSYLGTTLLPWNGFAFVEMGLQYPREFLREAVRVRMTIHTTRWIYALFEASGSVRERTACLPSLPIPGYGTACNLTESNGGLPYFCGRPTDRRLNCSHRKYVEPLKGLSLPPLLPPAEQKLLKKIDRHPFLRLIPNNITVRILSAPKPTKGHQNLPPCWKRSPDSTWSSTAPRGWMSADGVWHPFTCSLPRRVDDEHVRKCLRHTSIFLVGDSNMRYWWYELRSHLNCSRLETGTHHHQAKLCEVQSHNTTLRWAFHGRPSYTVATSDNVPLPTLLAQLRHDQRHDQRHPQRRVIVLLHYYLHFTYYSLPVFRTMVRAAKRHIQDFLQEFPTAKFVIRGPHLALDVVRGFHLVNGDIFGPAYIQIWHNEFKELRGRVWFLDFWDMTVATRNRPVHPPPFVVREMVKVVLGHVCEGFP
ncbi:NXPE family member 3-like [Babylonia areolata]|uniref:NXPE family member 3-like n=1 Tax=Babylonia areolata TaxID=304850 RepID=UPI003FD0FA2A